MSDGDGGADRDGAAEWPVSLRGVTESVVTTRGPDGRWNVAALGLHAGDPVTARTWGDTRTRRNLRREGGGVVQFVRDPVVFADAALALREVDDAVLDAADAWARVSAERVDAGTSGGTRWTAWALTPREAAVERESVPTINRGFNAVVEATVAASRLGVDAYDDATLCERLDYFADVALTCGGAREREAVERVAAVTDGWQFDPNPDRDSDTVRDAD